MFNYKLVLELENIEKLFKINKLIKNCSLEIFCKY